MIEGEIDMEQLKSLKDAFFMMGVFCSIWGFSKDPVSNVNVRGGAILMLIAVVLAMIPVAIWFSDWLRQEE